MHLLWVHLIPVVFLPPVIFEMLFPARTVPRICAAAVEQLQAKNSVSPRFLPEIKTPELRTMISPPPSPLLLQKTLQSPMLPNDIGEEDGS
jgi:hypothetical protein